MKKVAILVNEDSLSINHSQLITGEIFFSVDQICFPEERWNDFAVILLSEWINITLEIIENPTQKVPKKFYFMDGPYFAQGNMRDNKNFYLDFYERNSKGKLLLFSTECNFHEFKESLFNTAEKVYNIVKNEGLSSSNDFSKYEKMVNRINLYKK